MMFDNSFLSTPVITYIPGSRYDERGRQLQFVESDVQRQQRLALLKGRNSPLFDSPCSSPSSTLSRSLSSSPSSSPSTTVIDISADPFSQYSISTTSSTTSSSKRGHRRRSSILNVIPEED
ncbi:hypothetical protein CC1G_09699 [Coprinopsis cinerea okayama7|uniref:Uncharacterized protein n=1 Tax=Coprinopsis cinerea (strain Okayama-7 / 130 / ATCC MYA-4618 / FGSC 9003) TaxID=240176 RepID=A8NJD4_COPC7|nr:hypothetical protein CC1G_09699 [Coprinopsis cinerea okayama7\|eukprot:XP_001834199.1 hypothetical protein CC1G_09699 [Coprinopsis cinerea okayama7\